MVSKHRSSHLLFQSLIDSSYKSSDDIINHYALQFLTIEGNESTEDLLFQIKEYLSSKQLEISLYVDHEVSEDIGQMLAIHKSKPEETILPAAPAIDSRVLFYPQGLGNCDPVVIATSLDDISLRSTSPSVEVRFIPGGVDPPYLALFSTSELLKGETLFDTPIPLLRHTSDHTLLMLRGHRTPTEEFRLL